MLVAAKKNLLGGSWVVICGVTSRVTTVIIHIRGLTTPFITPPEPPSNARTRVQGCGTIGLLSSWACEGFGLP